MKVIVTGATGFVGQHFVEMALQRKWQLTVLCHRQKLGIEEQVSKVVYGDIGDADVWRKILSPGSVVVNLAFTSADTPEETMDKLGTMVNECVEAKVKRIVHCSTTSVYGSTSSRTVDEETLCMPDTPYANVKYLVEKVLSEKTSEVLDLAIARPAEVFGKNGKGLVKLIGDLESRHPLVNYLAACINGRRPMHLVAVTTLVEGLLFLCDYPGEVSGEKFIVSEDDAVQNNYRDVAAILMEELKIRQLPWPQINLPLPLLCGLLRIAGKPSAGTGIHYDNTKFEQLGFSKSKSFEDSLRSFCRENSSENPVLDP